MANKRIKDLTERTTISSGDFLATDNSNGTRKVDASKIMTPISTAQSTADLVTDKVSGSGDAFSSTKGYSVGDLVIGPTDNLIYRCKTAYSTGASWNSRKTYFEQVTLVDAVSDLNSALSNIPTSLSVAEYSGSTSYSIGAGGSASLTVSISNVPTGYTMLGVSGWAFTSGGVFCGELTKQSNTQFRVAVANVKTSTASGTAYVRALYGKLS